MGPGSSRQIRTGVLLIIAAILLASCGPLGGEEPAPVPSPTPNPTPTSTPVPVPTPTPTPQPTSTPEPTPTPHLETSEYTYEIVNTFPHDRRAFTQGLEFRDGYIYESTGLRGESSLRRVELETGEVLQRHALDEDLFGEGLTILADRIFQLTWQAKTGFVFDKESFEPIMQFFYDGEGWGLTNDGDRLIMSDGSNTLSFRDPEGFVELDSVDVYDDRGPVVMLNELEFINGEIWANIWMEDQIVVIDPESGWVTRRIDMTGLLQDEDRSDHRNDVLNGIAWDAENERVFVTGKLWPVMYEIDVVPVDPD